MSQPVIFDIAYTPYRLKSGATAEELKEHKRQRAYYDMTGVDNNIYKYMTTEGKLFGEQAKKYTMLEYLQKSTGVFNKNGMLSKEEVKEMKQRVRTGEKNIWHGWISFDEQHSKMIDHPDKCIALVKQVFGEFFKDAGFNEDNIDLMCALHLDRPTHLHIHYVFWERAPKIKNKRAAGYLYRKKGKIAFSAIDKMTERLNSWALPDDIAKKRQAVTDALFSHKDFSRAQSRDYATKLLKDLAKKLPTDKPLYYASKEMALYRDDIDYVVKIIAAEDEKVGRADRAFRDELKRKQTALQDIMGKYYKARLEEERKTMTGEPPAYYERYLGNVHTIEKLDWDYRRRMGNIVLKKVRYIQENTYRYNKKRKHKTNDKFIKKHLAISNRIIKKEIDGFFSSLAQLFTPEINSHSSRLKEIEEEIRRKHEEESEAAQEGVTSPSYNNKWQWSK